MAITRKHAYLASSAALIAGIVGAALFLKPSLRIAPDGHLPAPAGIPQTAQQLLRSRMERHGTDMGALISAVVLLDWKKAEERARNLAADASLARPLTGDATELNSLLPSGFFDMQDALKQSATKLAETAARGDSDALVSAYGQLSQTCLNCHLLYANAGNRPR